MPFQCSGLCTEHARQKGESRKHTGKCIVCRTRLNLSGLIMDAGQLRCVCCNSLLRVKSRLYGKKKIPKRMMLIPRGIIVEPIRSRKYEQ